MDGLTCLDLFKLHLRLTHYYVALRLTPERYHGCGCQGNLRGLHYCPLLRGLQHLNETHFNKHTQLEVHFTKYMNNIVFSFIHQIFISKLPLSHEDLLIF